jgi:hypothetical protein
MPIRRVVFCSVTFLTVIGTALEAQPAAAPTVYTVTEANSMGGASAEMKVYRNGSKAAIDHLVAADGKGGKATHTRTVYDLQNHQSFTWDATDPAALCGSGNFSGNWGDPFTDSVDMSADLVKQNAKQVGTETLHGFATKVYEATVPGAKAKVWLEAKSNLVVKLQMIPPTGDPQTMLEITELSLTPPPASVFTLNSSCAAAAAAPRVPTESERVAAETGGNAQDFANGILGPGSKNACTMLFRVVRAGSMQPIVNGFQVALDQTVDLEHPAAHTIGVSSEGHSTFAGGGLHEMTSQLRNGVLRIENVPAQFDVELVFTKGESSSALIYGQCVASQSVLLYVVKNPDKLSDGDWLWVKSGKYATVAP